MDRRFQGKALQETEHPADSLPDDRPSGTFGEAIVVIDRRDRIVCASAAAEMLLRDAGQTSAPLAGCQLTAIIRPDRGAAGPGTTLSGTGPNGSAITVEVLGAVPLPSLNGDARVLRLHRSGDLSTIPGQQAETVAVLAHEMKTPLTAIIGALTLIDAGAVAKVATEVKPLVEMALRNARRVHTMINDVLDMETIPADGMALQPIDLDQVVRRSMDAFGDIATARNVVLRLQDAGGPLWVQGNAERLERAVENLLSNAIKFSDPGGAVEVRLDRDAGRGRITVADAGPGIPPDFQPMVFRKFAKHDFEDGRNREGTGLGLSIARAIVQAHGGRIEFASRPGDTWFRIEIPANGDTGSVK